MNKKMLAEQLAKRANITTREAHEQIGHFVDIINTSIFNGVPVSVLGFGTFSTRLRKARDVCNIHSPKRRIPGAIVPVFHPSHKLRKEFK